MIGLDFNYFFFYFFVTLSRVSCMIHVQQNSATVFVFSTFFQSQKRRTRRCLIIWTSRRQSQLHRSLCVSSWTIFLRPPNKPLYFHIRFVFRINFTDTPLCNTSSLHHCSDAKIATRKTGVYIRRMRVSNNFFWIFMSIKQVLLRCAYYLIRFCAAKTIRGLHVKYYY